MRGAARGRGLRRGPAVLGALLASLALVAGCAGAGALGAEEGVETVTVAIVSNPQMEDAISLSPQFEAENPGIRLRFVSLSENEARAKITASVATGGGEFDIVMISNYETPQWAQNGWLTDLQPYIDATPGYDAADFIPTVRDSLSYQGPMYSVPFYGESSFLMYRKDLFQQAGIQMPAQPTWPQVAEFAARLDQGEGQRRGICLRGKPGWGEVMAPLDTVINTFGGRWFDPEWRAQLDLPGGAPGRAVLRRPRPPARPARRLAGRVLRVRDAVRPGPGRHVVRRDVGRRHRRGPRGVDRRRADRVRARPGRGHAGLGLAVLLVARHPGDLPAQGRGVEVHVLDDEQAVHRARRPGGRVDLGAARAPVSRRTTSRSTSRCRAPTAR